MPQLTVRVNGQMVRQGLQNLAADIPQVGRLQIYRASQRVQKRMKQPGSKPSYPIPWASEKQRRAFFATDGFGGGIPHSRTNAYVDAWKIERIGDTGYQVVNRTKAAKYVGGNAYGLGQSQIHAGRWPLFRDVAEDELKNLPEEVAKEIRIVARRSGLSK